MYNIALCDDCKEYIQYLKDIISEANKQYNFDVRIYEYSSGEELICNLDDKIYIDLLILDMELGGLDGDETARIFREKFANSVLVFCSGVRLPTIESFKATPFRYILKQQNRQEIVKTMQEVLYEVQKKSFVPSIMSHYRGSSYKIILDNILYFENAKRGSSIIVHPDCEEVKMNEKLLVDKKPPELEGELKQFGFALAQSSYLVNMNHIKVLRSEDLIFDTGEILKISRSYKKVFTEAFVKHFGNKY